MIGKEAIEEYLRQRYGPVRLIEFRRLGTGVHGTGFSLVFEVDGQRYDYVIKDLIPEGLGHDYPSDRASVFLLAYDEYNRLPRHVRAIDVLALREDGSLQSISGGREYFLIMEKAEGTNYFNDLEAMKQRDSLLDRDRKKIHAMTDYLREIHSRKKDSRTLYWRKLRDTIGHGECLMGVFDSYPEGILTYEEMAEIEKLAVDYRAKLKPLYRRLSQIHGDFHPGNIWFSDSDFVLLDRSRGPWGEPADDITALSINYIFYSIMYHNQVKGAYREALILFYDTYIEKTSDEEILSVVAPFYAFRGAVVAHPLFYPQLSLEQRHLIFRFVRNVLRADAFDYREPNRYLQ